MSQHFENQMGNKRLRAHFIKLSRICNLSPFQDFFEFLEVLQKKKYNPIFKKLEFFLGGGELQLVENARKIKHFKVGLAERGLGMSHGKN